ncbi:glycoside hydrolase family 43 protein [Streptosporangiaceae bacterium NEAU-GS5]|nr:glycoside hydrolase family 43 protein [Streptosporangiaceae bacterium NEAU-GS5]
MSHPVIPGFHPDPSVCRVGEDYYLVTSSFEWFPGVPVFHSRDLVHWRQIGHAVRPGLDGVRPSGGIYAATIRHHDGLFHVITTNVDGGGNFYVTAADPAGPWSEPVWLDAEGFDPSLLFDGGHVWICGVREKKDRAYDGDTEIWLRELGSADERIIWDSPHEFWTEGPHVYRKDDWYYLITAEGGTDIGHAVMAARSRSIEGPYEPCPHNPILTHRNQSREVFGVGHADLVDTPAGQWWMVVLGTRSRVLGRETFLAPVAWQDGWPVVGPLADVPAEPVLVRDEFHTLGLEWNHLRTPRETYWTTGAGLTLRARPETLCERVNPSLIARRIQHTDFTVATSMDFAPENDERAGLVLVQNDDANVRLTLGVDGVSLVTRSAGVDTVRGWAPAPGTPVTLEFEARGGWIQARCDGRDLGPTFDMGVLAAPVGLGFTGAYAGLYVTSDGRPSANTARFAWFEYRSGIKRSRG